ncbi:ABC transporter ATP-binding protein [Haloferacaceae archaeon DSL9]
MAELTLSELTKIYDGTDESTTAVDDLSLVVEDGEFLVLVGPSGCGKSTTLRMLAGLEPVTDGTIEIGSRRVERLAPSERDIAMVFQSYALYTKMTARGNMAYGLKHSTDLDAEAREERVVDAAELLGIEALLDDRPAEMSGGQKQRVALGRAIVREPSVFLLDEPLSNLDAKLRAQMRTELQRIQEDLGVTTVYVTHDQTEAMTMADRIAIMNDGVLQQVDPPEVAYDHPVNEFVGTFLGSPAMNVFEVSVERADETYRLTRGATEIASLPVSRVGVDLGETVRFGIRPEDVSIDRTETADCQFDATVRITEYQGNDNFVYLDVEDQQLIARVPPRILPDRGEHVSLAVSRSDVYLFDPENGAALKTRGTTASDTSPRRPNLS